MATDDRVNPDDLRRCLDNASFQAVVERLRSSLQKTVMAEATTAEERERALSQYHALKALIARLRAAAHIKEQD